MHITHAECEWLVITSIFISCLVQIPFADHSVDSQIWGTHPVLQCTSWTECAVWTQCTTWTRCMVWTRCTVWTQDTGHRSVSNCTAWQTVEWVVGIPLIGNSISRLNNEWCGFPQARILCILTGFLVESAAMKIEVWITQSDVLDKWFHSSHTSSLWAPYWINGWNIMASTPFKKWSIERVC